MKSLAQRSITSISWNALASVITVAVLFVRSVLLARLLPVDVFGVYAGASAVIGVTVIAAHFGLGSAFLHRAPESQDEERAARGHFTLKLLFTSAWFIFMIFGTLLFAEGATRTALLVLTATTAGIQLAETPRLILVRRVVHRRLAALQVLTAVATTAVAVSLAWRGLTLWALLATNLVTLFVVILALYVWRPVWKPRVAWSPQVVRYYLEFGSRVFAATGLQGLLDRLGDLWTRFYLGATPLGFYSRAYTFASYPRRFLADPVAVVMGGAYAELKEDRRLLSKTFFWTNAFLVRIGFFVAGLFALVAPEFIRIVLGEKWLPMLMPFRLMLIFTMLDPIRGAVGNLFAAVGRPGLVVRARLVQLGVLVLGLALLGPELGITGVAIAVTSMCTVGMVLLLWQARSFVTYSPVRLFGVPTLALVTGMLLAGGAITLPGVIGTDWRTTVVKTIVFMGSYAAVLIGFERRQTLRLVSEAKRLLSEGSVRRGASWL